MNRPGIVYPTDTHALSDVAVGDTDNVYLSTWSVPALCTLQLHLFEVFCCQVWQHLTLIMCIYLDCLGFVYSTDTPVPCVVLLGVAVCDTDEA